jgi:hypothetical protein
MEGNALLSSLSLSESKMLQMDPGMMTMGMCNESLIITP